MGTWERFLWRCPAGYPTLFWVLLIRVVWRLGGLVLKGLGVAARVVVRR